MIIDIDGVKKTNPRKDAAKGAARIIFEALSGISFFLCLIGACGVDGPQWIKAFAMYVGGAIGTYVFYRAAEWVEDRDKRERRK